MDEVVVSGEQPGPGLWKVTRGDHVLWVLGTLTPLPKKMTWRSREVETVISQSKEVIGQESVSANVGFFRAVTLLPSLLHARYNPDGAQLKDVLPPDLYARWARLKAIYLGDDAGIEKWRPMFAALRLYMKAIDRSGLTQSNLVWPVVSQAAKKYDVHVTKLEIKLDVDKPKEMLRDFSKTPKDADVGCLEATIERLETDLGPMRQRANAWATGDVAALQQLPFPNQEAMCIEAFTSAPGLQDKLNALKTRFVDEWVFAAESALSRNEVSFAMLPMSDLLRPDGRMSKLRAKGYAVEQP
jgi:uncharacterized protein YbaP (TraB family)